MSRKRDREATECEEAYDLRPIQAPKLKGTVLQMFTNAIESTMVKHLLVPKILSDSGIQRFRDYETSSRVVYDPLPVVHSVSQPAPVYSFSNAESLFVFSQNPEFANRRPKGSTLPTCMDYYNAYLNGKTNPEDVARSIIKEVSTFSHLNALIYVNDNDILRQARLSAQRWADGKPLSILDGVPIAVKDETDCLPYVTEAGTHLVSRQPTSDATIVARLRAAGAIMIGKTNMHELGFGITGHNLRWGIPRNPHAPGYHTGGSSSGSGVAVGVGMCPIALGGDGGGSVRLPACYCGVVGLKPSFGRVSRAGHLADTASILSLGPLGQSVMDCLISYVVMAGHDDIERDSATRSCPDVHCKISKSVTKTKDLSDLRIGVFKPWFEDCDPQVRMQSHAMVKELELRGARVVNVVVPNLQAARWAHIITISCELMDELGEQYDKVRSQLLNGSRVQFEVTKNWSSMDFMKAQRIRHDLMFVLGEMFRDQCDVIITPMTAIPPSKIVESALPHGELAASMQARVMQYAFLANLTGVPAISVPIGYVASATGENLPIGLQIMSAHWREDLLFRCAFAVEEIVERKDPPNVAHILPCS
eukprot:ANDGO_03409.mRNA.1 Fatty acid amide hydrolase